MTISWQMFNDDDGDNCRWWKIMMTMLMIIAMKIDKIHLATGLHPHANWSRLLSPCRSDLMSTFVKFWKPSHPQALITPLSANNPRRKINPTDPYTVCQSDTSPSSNHIEPSSHSVGSKMTQNRSADPCTVCHSGTSGRRPSTWRSETPGETN